MNKAEFAVCRVKEKLPRNRGFLTKGSGCVVHCETLTTSWGWKCHYFIVTPSVVLCREDLSSDKTFVIEFLSKDKRGLETFEVKQMAEVCKDLVGRSMNGDVGRDNNLSFLSVEPLDKRGFLKKMVKKGSLQTFRPLDCLDSQSKFDEESLINEGLFCHVIADLFSESTNLPFSSQTFKLAYEPQTRQFSLQDFGGSAITFSHVKPPIGAVIFTKKGEFAGVVNFVDHCTVSPVFLPEPSITANGQEERPRSCDEMNVSTVAIASDKDYFTECNQDPGSDVLCDENSHSGKCAEDMLHYNNNASVSSEGFLSHAELGIVKFQQDQGCTDNVISGAPCKTDQLQTENILDSSNRTANVKSNFEESLEEDTSNFPVTVEEASDKMEDAERSISLSSNTQRLINSNAEIEQTALSSGSNITRDDDSLVTVIQVGDMKPLEMETTEQVDTSREELAEQDHLVCGSGEIVSSNYEGSVASKEQADIREAVIECSPDDEDGQMVPTNKDDLGDDEMNLATDDSSLCISTENEPVALIGSIREDKNNETDSIQKPNAHVGTEASVENSQGGNATLVTLDDNDLPNSSEGTFDTLLENPEVSIYVTPANEDDVNHSEEGDNMKESPCFQEDVSEDSHQEHSSVAASFSPDVTDEMIGEEMGDTQLNVDNDTDLCRTESAQKSGVDISLNLEQVDAEENTEVMSKDLNEHVEAELGECPSRFDGDLDQAVITHKEFSKPADEAFVSAEICENSDHNQNELDPAESPDLTEEAEADKCPTEDSLSSDVASLEKEVDGQDVRTILQPDANEVEGVDKEVCHSSIEDTPSNVVALEKRIDEQDIRTALETVSNVKQVDAVDEEECGVSSPDDAIVLQRVDADSLLTETITNNPPILRDLGKCLDTEYQHGRVPCWRDLAELLDIPPEAYEHCGTFSATSPTEDLFVFLAATKPQLTIQDIQEALRGIDRHEVVQLLDRKIAGGIISKESVVGSLVERDDTDILGRMALKLDRKSKNDWRGLALQLSVPQRVLRNFGSHQRHNSSLVLLKYIPIFDPELTVEHLKGCLVSIGRQDAVQVLENAGIPGDEPVKDILDDSDLLDQITDLLNEDPPAPHWRHLAKELKIPQEKCKIFEPTEDSNSPTKLLFKSIENWEPDLTFEELVLALVAMKRHDVLNVLQKYFSSDDVDQILEENNLLAPVEDHPDENES